MTDACIEPAKKIVPEEPDGVFRDFFIVGINGLF
jgi:hypothetical protein